MSATRAKVWVIDRRDNAGTVVGGDVTGPMAVAIVGGMSGALELWQPVPYGHKVALANLSAGTPVIKYGCVIGRLSADVRKGEHMHSHNLESLRGRGDLSAGSGTVG